MQLKTFDYILPQERIAQYPLKNREDSRLLVLHRESGQIEHHSFRDLPYFLHSGDGLVLNNTRVERSRCFARKQTGGRVEVLFLRSLSPWRYEVLLRSSGRLKVGSRLYFKKALSAELVGGNGWVKHIAFKERHVQNWIHKRGLVPLPPYIQRNPTQRDLLRYQTVYAKKRGAVAAPTAGLHFTATLLRRLEKEGVYLCPITLHVGYGTFEPLRQEKLSDNRLHKEYFEVPKRTVALLNRIRKEKGRVVSVGTTSCRVLETIVQKSAQRFRAQKGYTDLFIYPPYSFQGVDALITNFHLPKSSLYVLVSAFGGAQLVRRAYQEAIRKKYRFYSYGDAMLIL